LSNNWNTLTASAKQYRALVRAALKGAESAGYTLAKKPGRGLSNVWEATKGRQTLSASVRTSRDRWLAFPPLEGGARWKTLDDVDLVIVAAFKSRNNPKDAQVYIFDAQDVRARFNAAYKARVKAGHSVRDDYGMWINLDHDDRDTASAVGAGLAERSDPIAEYPLIELMAELSSPNFEVAVGEDDDDEPNVGEPKFANIAEVMTWARQKVAELAGVKIEAVKLDLKVQY